MKKINQRKFTKEQKEEMISMYLNGKNTVEIAKKFNSYNTSIRRILIDNNIRLIGISERLRKVHPDVFNNVNCPITQYWIGAIAADGCLTKGALTFAVKDKEWAQQLASFLSPEVNVNKYPKNIWGVAVRSKGLIDNLKHIWGLSERKSLNLKLKCNLTIPMLRGIIDGDGCWSICRWREDKKSAQFRMQITTASLDFANQLKLYLEQLNFNPTLTFTDRNRKNRYYSVSMFKQEELKELIKLLYSDLSKPYLKRKYEKIGSFLSENLEN